MTPPRWRVALTWAVVGEGGHVAIRTSHWWEVAVAAREHRPPRTLYHGALELVVDGRPLVVEMTPTWGRASREVVATGPVGSRWLGWSPFFRYEIRYTRPPALSEHEGSVLRDGREAVEAVLDAVPRVPRLTWGRAVGPSGDMWSSNSVVSWVLADARLLDGLGPPPAGRAPGWDAGLDAHG